MINNKKSVVLSLFTLILCIYMCLFSTTSYASFSEYTSSNMYARILVPGGQSVKDGLTYFVHGPLESWECVGTSGETLKLTIKGRVYVTHSSNVIIYEKF